MIVPIGVEGASVQRIPWVSISLALLCVVCFVFSWVTPEHPEGADPGELERALTYWADHPYLEPSPEFRQLLHPKIVDEIVRSRLTHEPRAAEVDEEDDGEGAGEGDFVAGVLGTAAAPKPATGADDEAVRAEEQATFDELTSRILERRQDSTLWRYSLVPAKGAAQPGWLTHMFLHFGWLHLLGNLFFFYLVGPMLEDVWGRPMFLAAYLLGGLAAAIAHAALDLSSSQMMLGASGAIAACMGGFCMRFAQEKIRMAYFWIIGFRVFRGTFLMPAWLWGLLWFGSEVLDYFLYGNNSGVAVMAHIGGFGFGFGAAVLVRFAGIEQKYIAPKLEAGTTWEQDPDILEADAALDRQDLAAARLHYGKALQTDSSSLRAEVGLAKVELLEGNAPQAAQRTERALSVALARKDDGQVLRILEDFGTKLPVESLRPQTAYRIAQLLETAPEFLSTQADRWYAVAGGATGLLAIKALTRAVELRVAKQLPPEETAALVDKALALPGLPPDTQSKLKDLRAGLNLAPVTATQTALEFEVMDGADTLPPPVVYVGKLKSVGSGSVEVEFPGGETRTFAFNQLAAVSAALVANGPAPAKPLLVTDLVLSFGDANAGAEVVRIPSTDLGLGALYPGVPAGAAYQKLLEQLTGPTGLSLLPDGAAVRAGKYPRFASQAELDAALYAQPPASAVA